MTGNVLRAVFLCVLTLFELGDCVHLPIPMVGIALYNVIYYIVLLCNLPCIRSILTRVILRLIMGIQMSLKDKHKKLK